MTECPQCGSHKLEGYACTTCPQVRDDYKGPIAKDLRMIARHVAAVSGLTTAELLGPCREARLAYPRFAFYKLATEFGYRPYPLAMMLKRNARTIDHGVRRMNEILEMDDNDQLNKLARDTFRKASKLIERDIQEVMA